MCLVLFAWHSHPVYAAVIAANRDEVYRTPALPLDWREVRGRHLLSGLDVRSGGTWMGVADNGRVGVVADVPTIRHGRPVTAVGVRSRGVLIPEFLTSDATPAGYAGQLAGDQSTDGFNVLVGDAGGELWWSCNRTGQAEPVRPGVHGLSNAAGLDPPWPKVVGGLADFEKVLHDDDGSDRWIDRYLDVLSGKDARRTAAWSALPDTGIEPRPLRKRLSARMVRLGVYGTRASTVLRIRHNGEFDMTERRFGRFRSTGETTIRGRFAASIESG